MRGPVNQQAPELILIKEDKPTQRQSKPHLLFWAEPLLEIDHAGNCQQQGPDLPEYLSIAGTCQMHANGAAKIVARQRQPRQDAQQWWLFDHPE